MGNLGEVVNACELEYGCKAVEEAADDEPVQRGGVVNLGQVGPAVHGDGGEGEHGSHAQRNPVTGAA